MRIAPDRNGGGVKAALIGDKIAKLSSNDAGRRPFGYGGAGATLSS
jgi:hypothetical protein